MNLIITACEEGDPLINYVLHKTSPCYLTIVLSWEGFMQK